MVALGPAGPGRLVDVVTTAAKAGKGTPDILEIEAAEAMAQRFSILESVDIPAGAIGTSPLRPEGHPAHQASTDVASLPLESSDDASPAILIHVIPSPPQPVLRSVHPLVTIAPGHTPSCLDDKVLRHLQKVTVTERQACSEVSSVRQEAFFDDSDCGYSGAGDQLGLDVRHVLLRRHHNDSAARPSRRSRTDCHIS